MQLRQIEQELTSNLKFKPELGTIQLLDHRLLMFNHSAFGSLRKFLIEQTGLKTAQMIFAKFGYESAIHDFKSADKLFRELSGNQKLEIGPIMHGWSGLVKVIPEYLYSNLDTKKFVFRGRWLNSYEALSHLELFGRSSHPVCYSLTGYGSAWCSQFFGVDLLEIETKCIACGDPYCEWEVRPWDEWDEVATTWKESLTSIDRSIMPEIFTPLTGNGEIQSNLEKFISQQLAHSTTKLRALCHDINAPLELAISNLTESISCKNSKTPAERAALSVKYAKRVVERFQKSQTIRSDFLSISRKITRVVDLVEESLQIVNDKLAAKQIRVTKMICPSIISFTDPDIAKDHVLLNILTNATKFSPLGSTITINATQTAPGQVCISISDQGIGIPATLAKKIVRGNAVSPEPGTSHEVGSGVGLSLAYFFVEKLSGNIELKSISHLDDPERCGTTVQVFL